LRGGLVLASTGTTRRNLKKKGRTGGIEEGAKINLQKKGGICREEKRAILQGENASGYPRNKTRGQR